MATTTDMPPAGTKMTRLKALAAYFNEGAGKRGLKEFQTEIKALSEGEKDDLAAGVCAITGWVLA